MTEPASGKPPGEGFGPEHRLRQRKLYLAAYADGVKAHGRLVVLFALRRPEGEVWRLGQTATRKIGGAVVRNRLRRLGREVFRRLGSEIPQGWDYVLNFKGPAAEAGYEDLRRDVIQALDRLGLKAASSSRDEIRPERGSPPPAKAGNIKRDQV